MISLKSALFEIYAKLGKRVPADIVFDQESIELIERLESAVIEVFNNVRASLAPSNVWPPGASFQDTARDLNYYYSFSKNRKISNKINYSIDINVDSDMLRRELCPNRISLEFATKFIKDLKAISIPGWVIDSAAGYAFEPVDETCSQICISFSSLVDKEIVATDYPRIAYHVTEQKYLEDILRNGLQPRNASQIDKNRIFITNKIYADSARSWVGARKKATTDFVLLKIDMDHFEGDVYYDTELADMSWYVTEPIPPNLITQASFSKKIRYYKRDDPEKLARNADGSLQ